MVAGGFDGASSSSPPVKASTASTTRPVLLVHGFAGTKSSWSLVAHTLSAQGLTVEAMSYPPLGTSVEQLAERLVAEVERILRRTGADKVHPVGHSLGGVVIAQAIADRRLSGRVDTVITLGSPFGGSPWAGVLPFVEIVRALRPGSPVLRRVASAPMPAGVRWLSVTAALDIIVPGLRSVPSHAQVETIMFDGVGHLRMLLSRQVIGCIAAARCAHRSRPPPLKRRCVCCQAPLENWQPRSTDDAESSSGNRRHLRPRVQFGQHATSTKTVLAITVVTRPSLAPGAPESVRENVCPGRTVVTLHLSTGAAPVRFRITV